jgi:predicted RNase H-like nuclease (RuvC/YqgF family)
MDGEVKTMEAKINEIALGVVRIEGDINSLRATLSERKEQSVQLKKDVDEAWGKIHKMDKELTRNNENTATLADRVAKLEVTIVEMRDKLIKVSVISTIATAAITAAVVEFFGR